MNYGPLEYAAHLRRKAKAAAREGADEARTAAREPGRGDVVRRRERRSGRPRGVR
jgi:hypothetical protein